MRRDGWKAEQLERKESAVFRSNRSSRSRRASCQRFYVND